MGAKESAVAKSSGQQQEEDRTTPDVTFFHVLSSKRKISKKEANYQEEQIERKEIQDQSSSYKMQIQFG
jgi:hypothetical protein